MSGFSVEIPQRQNGKRWHDVRQRDADQSVVNELEAEIQELKERI
jgi:hypothetical protein